MENETIRRAARKHAVPLWKVAIEIGVSEATLTRWLRTPLDKERYELVETAIQKLGGMTFDHDT